MDVHAIRKKINYLTFGILWYLILTDNISKCVDRLIPHLMTNKTGKYIDNYLAAQRIDAIVAVGIGFFLLLFFFKKQRNFSEIFTCHKRMPIFVFLSALSLGFILNIISGAISEHLLSIFSNYMKISAADVAAAASGGDTLLSGIFYTSLMAPIVEEIIYRGFIMNSLRSYGKVQAIVFSSVLFSLMHCNFDQFLGAFCQGIILGYLAMAYGIIWSIGLHIFTDAVLLDFVGCLSQRNSVIFCCALLFFAVVVFIVWIVRTIKNHTIINYVSRNTTTAPIKLCTLTSVVFWIFSIYCIVMAIINFQF